MTADTGLCALSHFDFHGGAGFQIGAMYAESAGSYLNNRIFTVSVKVFVQSAFTGVVANPQRFGGFC